MAVIGDKFDAESYLEIGDLHLEILKTDYEKEVVNDKSGVDYLWTRIVLRAHLLYNPKVNSARLVRPLFAVSTVTQVNGRSAPQTEMALRSLLMIPRQQLTVVEGGETIVDLPGAGKICDVNNGPTPLRCRIKKKHGVQTWEVELDIEFHLREEFLVNNPADGNNVLLSNRWTMTHHLEGGQGQFREIITRKGTAVFNPQRLIDLGHVSDDYRKWLLGQLSPPNGYNRGLFEITVDPDGRSLNYTVQEVRTRHKLGVSGITKVSCIQKEGRKVPNVVEGVMTFVNTGINYMLNASQTIGSLGFGGDARLMNPLPTLQSNIQSTFPVNHHIVMVTVYGDMSANIANLSSWAHRAVNFRMSLTGSTTELGNIDPTKFNWDSEETVDVENVIVTVVATAISGIGDQVLSGFGNVQAPTENIIVAGLADFAGGQAIPGAGMPFKDNGTRGSGTSAGALVAQMLQEAFEKPLNPTAPINPTATTNPHR